MASKTDDVVSLDNTIDEPVGLVATSIYAIQWKKKFALFIILLIVMSTMCIENVIAPLGPDMIRDPTCTTNKGTMVQIILIVGAYTIAEFLINNNII